MASRALSLYRPTRIACDATVAHGCACPILDALPIRFRPPYIGLSGNVAMLPTGLILDHDASPNGELSLSLRTCVQKCLDGDESALYANLSGQEILHHLEPFRRRDVVVGPSLDRDDLAVRRSIRSPTDSIAHHPVQRQVEVANNVEDARREPTIRKSNPMPWPCRQEQLTSTTKTSNPVQYGQRTRRDYGVNGSYGTCNHDALNLRLHRSVAARHC